MELLLFLWPITLETAYLGGTAMILFTRMCFWQLTIRSFFGEQAGEHPRKCQTSTASPAEPGELPMY